MSLGLLDWRRRVHSLYGEVRAQAEHDPAAAHQRWRAGRDALFAEHPDSPLTDSARSRFAGLPVAPYDAAFRFDVAVQPATQESFETPAGRDGVVGFLRLGRVDLPGLGPLDVWWSQVYGGGVFLPIRDGSAGRQTYGGGRYVLDTVKGADLGGVAPSPGQPGGRLVVDLNFAYNPSCAYDPSWTCPLAPPGNVLENAVPVGELFVNT